MFRMILILIATLIAIPASAQVTCQRIGEMTFCSDGSSSQDIGNQRYYSNGQTRQTIGNMDYYSAPPPVYQAPPVQYPDFGRAVRPFR